MKALHLKLHDFRNYARAELSPAAGITALTGDNAQGKTALLEALYLCCTGRSHRTARDRDLIRWGQPLTRVTVVTQQSDGSHEVEITLPEAARKQVKVNGTAIARSGELMGHVCGVLFSPEDLALVKAGPAERRRFIDMELSQIRPAYYYALQRYQRALTQRGRLLRDAFKDESLLKTLPSWDEQLASSGASIIEYRRAFVEKLAAHAGRVHAGLSGGREALDVRYACSIGSDESGAALAQALYIAFDRARASDLARGITSVGPHRDDLVLTLNAVDARAFGSQGQQRSCALSLKLAELKVMHEETGEHPILMLDDVLSELDPSRRRQLLHALGDVQTLITCTDPADLAGAEVSELLKIEHGTICD